MALQGIPISDEQCIGDSLVTINNAFLSLDASVVALTASGSTSITGLSSTVDARLTALSAAADNNFATKSSILNYLPLSGGTMTGTVNISSVTETKQTPVISANTLTLNLASAVVFHVNLNSNITTFTLTNVPPSPRVYSFALQLSADGTSRSVIWPTGTRWSGGSGPTLTTTAGKVDTFTFLTHDGGSNWFAFTNNQNQ